MVLLIDNYDSFSYNLYQLVGQYEPNITVVKNDAYNVEELKEMNPSHLILSPGPGRPDKAGVCEEAIQAFAGKIPVLGVCLGHQAICEVFGGKITYARELVHGKKRNVHIANGSAVFRGLPPIMEAARYHSLCVERQSLPDELLVIAEDEAGEVMGVKHAKYDIYGLQFHPESIMTPGGATIMKNFLKLGGEKK